MFRGIIPILWEEWVVFKRGFLKITASAVIGPILYIVAFGFGMGGGFSLKGVTYIKFLIPGVIALTTMNSSYKAIAITLNTNRLYDKTFEQYVLAPVPMVSFCIGKAIAGSIRGLYCGFVVLLVAMLFDVELNISASFVMVMVLSGLIFACLGMYGALIVKSHADMTRFGTYVMMPMTFLCGTFFSVEQLPGVLRDIIYALPLTHISTMLRSIATYEPVELESILIAFMYLVLFFTLSLHRCNKVGA